MWNDGVLLEDACACECVAWRCWSVSYCHCSELQVCKKAQTSARVLLLHIIRLSAGSGLQARGSHQGPLSRPPHLGLGSCQGVAKYLTVFRVCMHVRLPCCPQIILTDVGPALAVELVRGPVCGRRGQEHTKCGHAWIGGCATARTGRSYILARTLRY